jgi:hypothetical protein
MKQGWELKQLGDVCDIINGKNQAKVVNSNGKYPIYGSGGIMDYADDFICNEGFNVLTTSTRKLCSIKCTNKYFSDIFKGEKNPNRSASVSSLQSHSGSRPPPQVAVQCSCRCVPATPQSIAHVVLREVS